MVLVFHSSPYKRFGGPKSGRRKIEAPEAFQKFLRASQACLPASNVARGRHTLSPTVLRAARAGRTSVSEIEVGPLGRGAVTGVHETDTLLCATKTCSHVCAASAPASVWFSCCTAHRTNVLVARKVADENRGSRSFPKVSRASQACLPASDVARGHHTLSPPLPPSVDCWPSRRRCLLFHRALMQGHDHSSKKRQKVKKRKITGNRNRTGQSLERSISEKCKLS